MKGKKSLGVNAVLNGLRTLLNLFFPLITFPYISRVLTVENIGKYNFSVSVIQYFLLIAALGISTYAIREGAKYRDDTEKFSRFASQVFSINIFSTIVSYILLAACMLLVPKLSGYRSVLLVLSIEIFFTTIGTEWIFSIYEEYAYITVRSIIFKILSIALLLLLVREPDDYVIYAGITVFANVGSNVMNYIRAKKYCNLKMTLSCNWQDHFLPIMVIFASLAATSVYVNSDTTMLGFMSNDYTVGIYSVSSKVYRIVKQMLSAILIVSIPRLSMLMGQNRISEYKKIFSKIFNILVIVVLPTVVGLFMISEEIVLLISTNDYVQAKNSLRLLCIALVFCIFGWIYNQCVLIPAKKEKIVLIATFTSAISNIIINYCMIPIWSENAAAFSTIVAEGIMMIVCVFFGRKIVNLDKGTFRNIFTVTLGCILIAVICLGVKCLNLGSLLTLIVAVGGSIFGYGIILILLRNVIVLDFLKNHHIVMGRKK